MIVLRTSILALSLVHQGAWYVSGFSSTQWLNPKYMVDLGERA